MNDSVVFTVIFFNCFFIAVFMSYGISYQMSLFITAIDLIQMMFSGSELVGFPKKMQTLIVTRFRRKNKNKVSTEGPVTPKASFGSPDVGKISISR